MLSCKTEEMADKEMRLYILAYNLIRVMMAVADHGVMYYRDNSVLSAYCRYGVHCASSHVR